MEGHLLIIDASSYIFRAYYGVKQSLSSPDGTPTNAVFGFKNMIVNVIRDFNPTHIATVFDHSGQSFRNQLYDQYKANRQEPPDDLRPQFAFIHELADKLNINVIKIPDVEADDVIGTLVREYSSKITTTIISADKDLCQLISESVHMVDTMKKKDYGPEEVKEKYGVPPELISDYLAITGDSSDNIPGARGIGPKGASKLLEEFPGLDILEKNLDNISGKVGEKLRDSWENVKLSKKLTDIKTDVNLGFDLDFLKVKDFDSNVLSELYHRLGFKSDRLVNMRGFESAAPEDTPKAQFDEKINRLAYKTLTTVEELECYLEIAEKNNLLCLDFETDSLDYFRAKIVGIALCTDSQPAVYIPCNHENFEYNLWAEKCLDMMSGFLLNPENTLVAHNIKYELQILKTHHKIPKCKLADTMIMAYLLHSDQMRYGLDNLAAKMFNHEMISFETVTGPKKDRLTFDMVAVDVATEYAAEDADVTLRLYKNLKPMLEEKGLVSLFEDLEMPLSVILCGMEREGILVDIPFMKKVRDDLYKKTLILEQNIYKLAGEEFNIASPKQLSEILFNKLGITEFMKKTKTGISTDASVLEKLAPKYEIASEVQSYRALQKLINTYLDILPELIHPDTGRIHTSFNQTVAATGRLSSSDPNLQNIPIRGEDGRKLRGAFIAGKGCRLISADYSQIELRVLAHLSNDPGLLHAFSKGMDIHTATASGLFNIPVDEVGCDARSMAKAINFGIIYGMGAFRLANDTGVSQAEAKKFIEKYFERFASIRGYMKDTIQFARDHGYVETLLKRRRSIPGIKDKNFNIRNAAERVAVNTTVQGSAADIIKLAMIFVDAELKKQNLKSRLLLQVHDELVFEVPEAEVDTMMELVPRLMSEAYPLKAKPEVECKEGNNWMEAH